MKSVAILIVAGLAVAICASFLVPPARPGDGLRADSLCRKLLADKENREALSWLEQSQPGNTRTIGDQDPEESLKIIRNL